MVRAAALFYPRAQWTYMHMYMYMYMSRLSMAATRIPLALTYTEYLWKALTHEEALDS